MPGGTPREGTSGAEASIGRAVRATSLPQSDGRPEPDNLIAAPSGVAGSVPRTDALGRPLAGDGIDPAERTPRSFHLSRGLLERARAAAYWLAQLPDRNEPTNVSELVERALEHEVERLEQAYNNGSPFPAVMGRMRTGPGASGVERIRRAQRARRRQEPATGSAATGAGDVWNP